MLYSIKHYYKQVKMLKKYNKMKNLYHYEFALIYEEQSTYWKTTNFCVKTTSPLHSTTLLLIIFLQQRTPSVFYSLHILLH